jgi:cytosine/uracil/thiamine/allantoin permease
VTDPDLFDRLYAYAWFVTFGLSFVAYLVLMRGDAALSSPGTFSLVGFDTREEEPSLRSG